MHELPTPPSDEKSGDSQAHRLEHRRARLKAQIAERRAQLSGWETDWQTRWNELERLSQERPPEESPSISRTIVASELQEDSFASQALERLEQLQSQIAEEHEQLALLRHDFSDIGSRVTEQSSSHDSGLEERLAQILANHSASLDQREKALSEREQLLVQEREEIASLKAEVEAASREAGMAQSLCDTFKRDWETALAAVAADRERLASDEKELAAERKALDAERKSVESARAALQKAQHEFELAKARTADSEESQQQSQLHDLTKQLEASQAEAASRREELARVWDELAGAHARAEESLKAERQMAAEAHAAAGRLEGMLAAAQEDFRQRLEKQAADHERELLARDQQWQPQVDAYSAQVGAYSAQVAELKQECDELEKALARAQEEAIQSQQAEQCNDALFAAQSDETRNQLLQELESLQTENTALRTRLEQAEKAANAAAGQVTDRKDMDELRRRFELAVQDVRELKQKNSELASELGKAKANPGAKPAAGGDSGKLDWEARKRQLLEQLEAEGEPEDSKRKTERLSIENTIRITDEVIAEKDRALAEKESEIAELQRVLEDQSNNLGGVAVGAAAISQMFDKDSLVVQERERLQELQELVKQNEIALSMERAKVARIQQEFEAKLSELESQNKRKPEDPNDKKKASGNWMQRLGLGDNKG